MSSNSGLILTLMLLVILPTEELFATDIILFNGKVVTVNKSFDIAEAVAITNGRIEQVGTNTEINKLADESTGKIDLAGNTLIPGFIDTHPHMIHVGSGAVTVVLMNVSSVEEIKQKIAERAATTREGQWIFTSSIGNPRQVKELPDSLEEERWPTRYDLDEAAPDNPVYIPTPWGGPRPAILNSQALELLEISKNTADSDQGIVILKDAETGEPTGLIKGLHAYNWNPYYSKISKFAPRYPIPRLAEGVEDHIGVFNSRGITAVYESHFLTETNIKTIQYLLDRDRLNIRMKLAPELLGAQWKPANAIDDWLRILKGKESDPSLGTRQGRRSAGTDIVTIAKGDRVQMLGTTLSSDGPISFGKAMMNEPYWDMDGLAASEKLPLSARKIAEIAMIAAKYDLRMSFPVGGDRMADSVLEALEFVNQTYPLSGKNWLIAHTPYMTQERLQRIRKLGLNITANSNSEYKMTKAVYEHTFRNLAEEMAAINTPWRWILDSGVIAAQSTDNVFATPMFTLWQSLNRGTEVPGESLMNPAKQISREEAIRLHTINGAKIMQWDDEIGSIEVGKWADMVVLDTDILTCPLDDIRNASVLATWSGGDLVFGDLSSMIRN